MIFYVNRILSKLNLKIIKIRKRDLKKEKASIGEKSIILNGQCSAPFDSLPFAGETLQYFIDNFDFKTVLDIGSGEGRHSDVLRNYGKDVTSIDFGTSVYFDKRSEYHKVLIANYYDYNFEHPFDAVWASHVLEHQPNPNLFLKKIFNDLKEGGVLCLTVPPLKHEIVGGHLTLWNAGLLIYHLVFAGFDCSEVSIKSYGYNISVIVKKKSIKIFPKLSFDKGDIESLIDYFPKGIKEPFNGNIAELNW